MELSHAPSGTARPSTSCWATTPQEDRQKHWRKLVTEAIQAFDDFLFFDHIYIGGGNAKHYPSPCSGPRRRSSPTLPASSGGIKIWDMDLES